MASSLNVGEGRQALGRHPDAMLTKHVKLEFPSKYSAAHAPTLTFRNHGEDPAYAPHVTSYVETKLWEGALLCF